MQTIVLRIARVYGPGTGIRWEQFPHNYAVCTVEGRFLPVLQGGKGYVDLIHLRDLVDAITTICTQLRQGLQRTVLNLGSSRFHTVNEIASRC